MGSVKDSFLKAAEKRGDKWAQKIIDHIREQDLPVKDARYHHLFCQKKLYQLLFKMMVTRKYCPTRNVDEVMQYIYSCLEEKSEECQFTMEKLLNQIHGDFHPNIRAVRNQHLKK